MCQCTPNIRTPWCGKPGCIRPPQALNMEDAMQQIKEEALVMAGSRTFMDMPILRNIMVRYGDFIRQQPERMFSLGTIVETTGDVTYFKGTVIGHYTTLEGHTGCAVQVLDSDSCKRVVHVNRDKHLRKVG